MVAAFEKLLKQLLKYPTIFKTIVQNIEQLFKTIVLFSLHVYSNSRIFKLLSKQLFKLLNYCQNNFANNWTIAKTISQTIDDTLNGPLVTLHQKLLENIQYIYISLQSCNSSIYLPAIPCQIWSSCQKRSYLRMTARMPHHTVVGILGASALADYNYNFRKSVEIRKKSPSLNRWVMRNLMLITHVCSGSTKFNLLKLLINILGQINYPLVN